MLDDERILLGNDSDGFMLTTHRVCSQWHDGHLLQMKTMMLEDVTACVIRSTPFNIFPKDLWRTVVYQPFGAILFILCLIGMISKGHILIAGAIVLSLLLAFEYYCYLKRTNVVFIRSSSMTIYIDASGMIGDAAKQLIEMIQSAKSERVKCLKTPTRVAWHKVGETREETKAQTREGGV